MLNMNEYGKNFVEIISILMELNEEQLAKLLQFSRKMREKNIDKNLEEISRK